MPSVLSVDYSPLRSPVVHGDVPRYLDGVPQRSRYAHWGLTRGSLAFMLPLLLLLTLGLVAIAGAALDGGRASWSAGDVVLMLVAVAFVLVIYVTVAVGIADILLAPRRGRALVRLARFVEANGLVFDPLPADNPYPGPRFEKLRLRDRVSHPDALFDYGLRAMPDRSGGAGVALGWYLAVPLERHLPHMVLAARGSSFDRTVNGTRLSLEGDFDRHFDLICPDGYERDALYVFTPDLMALLIDRAARFDAEIIDDRLLLYPHLPLRVDLLGEEDFHRRMIAVAATVGAKTASRSRNYTDARLPGSGGKAIGRGGRRLKGVVTASTIIVPILIASSPFWGFIVDAFVDAASR